MFTGIVREKGLVRRLGLASGQAGGSYRLSISCSGVYEKAGIGDSVAVNGACLTVTEKAAGVLHFDVMAETVRKTALSLLRSGEAVNLENSLSAGGGLDGHFVLGHIDCVGTVKELSGRGEEFVMRVIFPEGSGHLVVEKGSVAIDGVSLTVGEAGKGEFSVYMIPHTLKETTLGSKRPGSSVNIEFDIIGKYIARLNDAGRSGITEGFLKEKGFR